MAAYNSAYERGTESRYEPRYLDDVTDYRGYEDRHSRGGNKRYDHAHAHDFYSRGSDQRDDLDRGDHRRTDEFRHRKHVQSYDSDRDYVDSSSDKYKQHPFKRNNSRQRNYDEADNEYYDNRKHSRDYHGDSYGRGHEYPRKGHDREVDYYSNRDGKDRYHDYQDDNYNGAKPKRNRSKEVSARGFARGNDDYSDEDRRAHLGRDSGASHRSPERQARKKHDRYEERGDIARNGESRKKNRDDKRSYSVHRDQEEYHSNRHMYAPGYHSSTDSSRLLFDPDMAPDYGDDREDKSIEMDVFVPVSKNEIHSRDGDGANQQGAVPVAVVHPSPGRNHPGNEREVNSDTEKVTNPLVHTEDTSSKDSSTSDSESDYEGISLADLGTVRTVDLSRTLRMRRRVTARGRLPILDLDQSKPETVAQANTAQTFINLYRQQKREQIKQQQTEQLTGFEKVKFKGAKRFKKTKSSLSEFLDIFEIWRSSFKTIEGEFGSSIVAYYRFVKWLFLVNLFTFLLVLFAIVLPQEFMEPDTFNDTVSGLTDGMYSEEHLGLMTDAQSCSMEYRENLTSVIDDNTIGMDILDFFLGTGWMEKTALFTGYYFNKTYFYELADESDPDEVYGELKYNMPLAFLLVTTIYFLVILVLMVNYTGKGVRDRLVNSGDEFNRCCHMILCGWDYNLSTEKAATLKHKNLFNEFFNDVAERKRAEERKNLSTARRVCLFVIRMLVWLFVFGVWAVSFYLIIQVVGTWVPELLDRSNVQDNWILTLIVEILPSLTITGIYVVAAPLFQIIVAVEDYTPETEVRITIARTVILRLASVGVLSFTLHSRITECGDEAVCGNCGDIECWETYVGQEFYKLVMVDFFVILGVTFFVEYPRRIMVKKFPDNFLLSKVGQQEFELPKNVLEIVYSQTISWIGSFFSPLIPAITVIKFFFFFYAKKLSLMHNCIPAKRPYRASKSNYFFMIVLMMSYALCLIIVCYAIGRIPPSQSCGPWRVYSSTEDYYMYTAVTDAIANMPAAVETMLNILTNWILYVILLIILCLIIYYYQAIASGNKRKVELLKEQLASEGMDKQFLLRQVNQVLARSQAVQ